MKLKLVKQFLHKLRYTGTEEKVLESIYESKKTGQPVTNNITIIKSNKMADIPNTQRQVGWIIYVNIQQTGLFNDFKFQIQRAQTQSQISLNMVHHF